MGDKKFFEGQEVFVFDINGRRSGQPEGGWPATIVKVGRTLVEISWFITGRTSRTEKFRMDRQVVNDGYGHRSFQTLEQRDLRERQNNAQKILRKHRITLEYDHSLTPDTLEAIVAVLPELPEVH